METFSEEHSKSLLGKEWLVKIDTQRSIPYLFKFRADIVTSLCCILATDTKNAWAEVLTSNQFARRWRKCHSSSEQSLADEDERSWRKRNLEFLDRVHSLGGIKDINFVVIEPHYGDIAFELEDDNFKWKWEPMSLGHKFSAKVLSSHLITPLISVTHLAFASADPVSELSEADLEMAVDKMGCSARRILETHVKHAISKPRVAMTLQRMTALINFIPDLPAIKSKLSNMQPDVPLTSMTSPTELPRPKPCLATPLRPPLPGTTVSSATQPNARTDADSATEPESDGDDPSLNVSKGKAKAETLNTAIIPGNSIKQEPSPPLSKAIGQTKTTSSDSESSPIQPPKKPKRPASSSDEDSEAEQRRHVAKLRGGGGAAPRGTKQPLKRGGKRF